MRKAVVCCLGWFLALCSTVWAVMDIEIVHGRARKITVVVEDFANQEKYPDRFQQYLGEIIRADLKNSGYFLPVKSLAGDARAFTRLRGDITVAGGVLQINYQLVASEGGKTSSPRRVGGDLASKLRVLLHGTYKIAPNQLRKVAHRISSDVYKHILNRPSIFETKLAYVLVNSAAQNEGRAKGRNRKKIYSIVVSDYDGFDTQQLLQNSSPIMSLSWSPDGKKLAYVSFEGHRSAIYIQDLDTGRREAVSSLPGINGAPAWSPDGKKLALVLTTSGAPKIHLLDLASRAVSQLTYGVGLDTEPNWSPDGRYLVFTSDRESGSPQIYRLELASGKVERVTYQGSYNARASFGGGGQNIVFLHREQGLFTVAVQNIRERKMKILATVGASGEAPTISPNGEMVIFVRNQYGRGTLSAVAISGERGMVLPGIRGEVRDPVWSAH